MRKQRNDAKLHRAIADRLRYLRVESGIRQEDVIFDTGISISRVETGKHTPNITTIAILCQYYGVSLSGFFEGIEINEDILNKD